MSTESHGSTDPIVHNLERQQFELRIGDELAALAAYRLRDGVFELVHTETRPGFEGRGAASRVVTHALDHVRSAGATLRPYCPYVRSFIERHPEYLDLIPVTERADFRLD